MDLYAIEDIDLASVREKLTGLNQQITGLEKQLAEASRPDAENPARMPLIDASAGEIIAAGNKAEKRAILLALIKKVEIDGETVKIHWKYI